MPTDASSANEQQPPLRPGVVLGPDGKPCKICTAFRHWKPPREKKTDGNGGKSNPAAMMAALAGGATTPQATSTEEYRRPVDCPPDVEDLGRATWTFLHTTAAYYPEKPTTAQRVNMLALLKAIPVLYPCKPCGSDFGDDLGKNPAEYWVGSRERLSRWLCERHNEVNRKLGKKEWGCEIGELDARWKDGPQDGRCE